MSNIVHHPSSEGLFTANPRGEVIIYPCLIDNGSWAVEHVNRIGEPVALLGTFLSFYDAEAAARTWAAQIGASFDGTVPL
jgi:hypothetical protein